MAQYSSLDIQVLHTKLFGLASTIFTILKGPSLYFAQMYLKLDFMSLRYIYQVDIF